jgi:ElaB/YqjD/DUF883 family membrane-anchored ribosome-binding protein
VRHPLTDYVARLLYLTAKRRFGELLWFPLRPRLNDIYYQRGMLMESSVTSSFAKTSQALADKAADKVQGGIRSAQETAKEASGAVSSKVEDLRRGASPALAKTSDQVQSAANRGLEAITDSVNQARDAASNATDSIVAYTKKNPAKALALAAGSGALLYVLIKALMPSRD